MYCSGARVFPPLELSNPVFPPGTFLPQVRLGQNPRGETSGGEKTREEHRGGNFRGGKTLEPFFLPNYVCPMKTADLFILKLIIFAKFSRQQPIIIGLKLCTFSYICLMRQLFIVIYCITYIYFIMNCISCKCKMFCISINVYLLYVYMKRTRTFDKTLKRSCHES